MTNKGRIKVFVTYAWGKELHNTRVISFTNLLRVSGFDANLDTSVTQSSTTTHFPSMMDTYLRDSDKVVVILSPEYKKKAEDGHGGVGAEYLSILAELHGGSSDKYILASFRKVTTSEIASIVPSGFKGYEILDLYKDQSNKFNTLFSKLSGRPVVEISSIASKTIDVETKIPPSFNLVDETNSHGTEVKSSIKDSILKKNLIECFLHEYKMSVNCKYKMVNGRRVIQKDVITKMYFENPVEDTYEGADFLQPYVFNRIEDVDNKDLLTLVDCYIRVDDERRKRKITERIRIYDEENTKAEAGYLQPVRFEYKLSDGGWPGPFVIPFKNKLFVEMHESRIVPEDDHLFVKRVHRLTNKFELNYTFEETDRTIATYLFSAFSSRSDISMKISPSGKSLKANAKNWLVPGDGIMIVYK
jgi:SEFIR domain